VVRFGSFSGLGGSRRFFFFSKRFGQNRPNRFSSRPNRFHLGAVAVRSGAEPETLVEGPAATLAARAQGVPFGEGSRAPG